MNDELFTNEDLLKFLEQDLYPSRPSAETSVGNFIVLNNLRNGKEEVSLYNLYALYKKQEVKPVMQNAFTHVLCKVLKYKQNGPTKIFFLNKTALELHEKLLTLLPVKRDKRKYTEYTQHFTNFLKYYKIKAGRLWIEDFALYYLYDKWRYKNKTTSTKILGLEQFRNFCSINFKSKLTEDLVTFYSVDHSIQTDLTDQVLTNLRTGWHNKHGQKDKKRKKS